jgi:hypothetical protein
VSAQGGYALTLWLGVAGGAAGVGVELTFRGVAMTAGLDEARDVAFPIFRLATEDELNEHELDAELGVAVFCVEPRDPPADAPRLFVVADTVELAMNREWTGAGRAPAGTLPPRREARSAQAVLDEVNGWCFGDWHVHARGDHALTLWLGDCCDMCCTPGLVTFRAITFAKGLEHVHTWGVPWFRYATDAERRDHALDTPGDARAFCIESKPRRGQADAPRVLIVARHVDVEPPEEVDYLAIAQGGRAARAE